MNIPSLQSFFFQTNPAVPVKRISICSQIYMCGSVNPHNFQILRNSKNLEKCMNVIPLIIINILIYMWNWFMCAKIVAHIFVLTTTVFCINSISKPPVSALGTSHSGCVVQTDQALPGGYVARIGVTHINVPWTPTPLTHLSLGGGTSIVARCTSEEKIENIS